MMTWKSRNRFFALYALKCKYYNIGFDVFYLPKKLFYRIFLKVMDEIRKISKMLKKKKKKKLEMKRRDEMEGSQEADFVCVI